MRKLERTNTERPDPRTVVAGFKINYWWLLIIGAILHRVPFALGDPSSFADLKRASLVLSYLLVLWALFHNLKQFGMKVFTIGTLLNFAAIVANGGLMPVSPEVRELAHMTALDPSYLGGILPEGSGILLPLQSTRLAILTDVIPSSHIHGVYSIGDVMIAAGVVLFLIGAARWTWLAMRNREHGVNGTAAEGRTVA